MITEDYVSFETAQLLKENGFDEKCCYVYNNEGKKITSEHFMEGESFVDKKDIESVERYNGWNTYLLGDCAYLCPTLQMAMKWLREVYNIDIVIDAAVGMLGVKVYVPFISIYKPLKDDPSKVRQIKRGIYYKDDHWVIPALQNFDSYEEATEAAIKYCLENLI